MSRKNSKQPAQIPSAPTVEALAKEKFTLKDAQNILVAVSRAPLQNMQEGAALMVSAERFKAWLQETKVV